MKQNQTNKITKEQLWKIGYFLLLILLIISLYYNVRVGSNAQSICDKKYSPLVKAYNERIGNIPQFNYAEVNEQWKTNLTS